MSNNEQQIEMDLVPAGALSPTPEKRSFLKFALDIAKKVWAVDAVKSVALTWLIRVGVGSTGAGLIVAIADAFAGGL